MGKANMQVTANKTLFDSTLEYWHEELSDAKINNMIINPVMTS